MNNHPKRRSDDLVVRRTGEDVDIYDPSTGTLVQLNATAFAIWQACDGSTSVQEITEALVLLTGNPAAELEAEVSKTVVALLEQGLLERE